MKNNINKIISIITSVFSVILLVLVSYLNLIPFKFYLPILIVILAMNFANVFIAFKVNINKTGNIIQVILSVLLSIVSIIASFFLLKTILFMNSLSDNGVVTKNYSVIVMKDSVYENFNDIEGKVISIFKNDPKESQVMDYLNSNVKASLKEAKDILGLKESLYDKKVEAIVIEDSYKALIEEVDNEFTSKTKVIHTFSLEFESEDISKSVDVTKNPFAIYISGIDTYGKVNSVSRSDVNIIAVVNPKTYQILLVSIPRDYYVQLHGTTGYKDKLTHAGMYGIDMSVQTIEDLLDMDINYYFKVNFTSLIDIVNALGGIDVYSEYSFDSEVGYYFYKGYNKVNGQQALAFARARHAFSDGDRQRGKNQQAVIEAVIRKVASKAIITKYDSLLNAVSGKFQTNLETSEISSLAKLQLDKMPKWTIKSISLNGSDSSNYTYTYSSGKLYVMEPNQNSINEAKENIAKILGDEELESSYGEVSNVKNPGIVDNTPKPPVTTEPEETIFTISLSSNDITLNIGETTYLSAKTTSTEQISWKSSNPDVATISDSGMITPISEGITTITASISGATANCIVRVANPLNTVLPDVSIPDENASNSVDEVVDTDSAPETDNTTDEEINNDTSLDSSEDVQENTNNNDIKEENE